MSINMSRIMIFETNTNKYEYILTDFILLICHPDGIHIAYNHQLVTVQFLNDIKFTL